MPDHFRVAIAILQPGQHWILFIFDPGAATVVAVGDVLVLKRLLRVVPSVDGNERRLAISNLLANTSMVAQQLTGLVKDNEAKLAPTLQRLNSVLAMLENQRDNLSKALPGLAKFELTQGETVSSGFYYNAYVPNVQPAQLLQPFFDYAFGFRRGVNAGQPPDNAGPRAELPFPYNGIPQPNERWGQP